MVYQSISCYHKIQVQNGWLKILEHNDSAFFRQPGVLRSENSADVYFYCKIGDFHLCRVSCARGHISTGSCAEITRGSKTRETELRGKQEDEKNTLRGGRAHTRRLVTYDIFCPNSARTYFHAARASHALSREPTNHQWRTADLSHVDDSFFSFFKFKRKFCSAYLIQSIEMLTMWSFSKSMPNLDYFVNRVLILKFFVF